MNSKQTRIVLIAMAGILLLWILSPLAGFHPSPEPVSSEPLHFDAVRAFGNIKDFATHYPNRVLGSFDSRHVTGYLRDTLEGMGYAVDYMQFSGQINGTRQIGRNILGYRAGRDPQILAVVAHYDTAATTIQGAMDNGSGVGVLIELARVLAAYPARKSILVVFTDGEEWGMLGSEDLAHRYQDRDRIEAVLSLDHVGIGDLAALRLEETGMMKGFTPPWYRILARSAAMESGLPVQSADGFREHLARTFYIPRSDQGPFLAAGIPALNLASSSVDSKRERAVYHSLQDTIDNLKISSVKSYGFAAERIVRSLDALPSIPTGVDGSFRLWDNLFMKPAAIGVLHAVLFIPLPICIFFLIKNHRSAIGLAAMGREFFAFLATFFPLVTFYLFILLARVVHLLPDYDLYPATAKDPVLQNPAWGIVAVILAAALIIAGLCIALFILVFRKRPRQSYGVSKAVLLVLLLATSILALFHNSYWAVTFLALPCWIWCLTRQGANRGKRLLNRIFILAAAVPACIVLGLFAARNGMGANGIWYCLLSLETGLFSVPGFFLAAAATAIGVRFMVIRRRDAGQE